MSSDFSFEIKIVYDNRCHEKDFLTGFGFSALIYNNFTGNYLLFDTGAKKPSPPRSFPPYPRGGRRKDAQRECRNRRDAAGDSCVAECTDCIRVSLDEERGGYV